MAYSGETTFLKVLKRKLLGAIFIILSLYFMFVWPNIAMKSLGLLLQEC